MTNWQLLIWDMYDRGLKAREIAEKLDTSEEAVKGVIALARENARKRGEPNPFPYRYKDRAWYDKEGNLTEMGKRLFKERRKHECQKCGKHTEGYHSCPYAEEIDDHHDEECCNCCEECVSECLDDI
jgi:hypothetical protein